MPLKTNLNNEPYFADYTTEKNYYEILFKPSVSVQVRELNNLQAQLQNQIEKFGDNIFKAGTIVNGCNFSFYPNYQYVKLRDNSISGISIDPSLYEGMFVESEQGLRAYVINSMDGFEASDPNLKTLYVNYVSSDTSGNTIFMADDTLTVHNGKSSIFGVDVINGSTNFSNNDTLVFLPVMSANVTTGTLVVGDYITDPEFGSNVEIIDIDTIVGSNNVLLYTKPRGVDLANASANSLSWTFEELNSFEDSTATKSGTIDKIFGAGATGQVITNGIGKIVAVAMVDRGEGYVHLPHVTVKSTDNLAGISSLNLVAKNYYDRIKISTAVGAVGNGYAFGVSEGVIYQLGHFVKVDPQIVIVNAYSSTPNNVSVGFVTDEDVINYTADSSLTDNALGTENENAPGADRMKLTPRLVIANTSDVVSNTEFLTLVEWNDGNPYKQNQVSIYSKIGDEMARRMDDASGNFVLDPFLVTTASVANGQMEGSHYTAVVDPGEAYINGYKTKTLRNFKVDVPKATQTLVSNTITISLNYDAYVRVREVGGIFQFSTGDTIDLYDAAKGFLSNTALITAVNLAPVGNKIGTARIRSMTLESGLSGDPTAIYRLYLFNVAMNSGKNFKSVKAVYYNNTNKGIADVVLERDATTAANVAVLKEIQNDSLVFKSGVQSIRNTNNVIYIYRTIDQTTTVANTTGLMSKSIAANPNETYPYSPTLSDADMRDLYVVPTSNNLVAYTALGGTVNVFTNSANLHGVGTSFLSTLQAGDYVKVTGGSSENNVKKVVSVTNNTFASLDSNCAFANNGGALRRIFPQNVPVPFGRRSGLSANLNLAGTVLTLDFGMTFEAPGTTTTALGCSIKRSGVTSTTKAINRSRYVKLNLATNPGGTRGPWCLGVPEAFRLRNVYVGTSGVTTSSPDIGQEFFIEPGHKANYCDLSYLYLNPKTSIALTGTDYLLVCFDYYRRTDDGYFDAVSYIHSSNAQNIATNDSKTLAELTSDANSFEVPEFYDEKGNYYDLLNCLDFRPAVANTVEPNSVAASAPTNPTYTLSFGVTSDPSNDKKFPLPDSAVSLTIEQYAGRTDVVVVGSDGNITVQQGYPSVDPSKRFAPTVSPDNLMLNRLIVPPYPNICTNLANNVVDIIDTSVHTNGRVGERLSTHTIYPVVSNTQTAVPSQPKGYSMADVGNLERRIKDLEYYQSLSILETSITNKIIPSSLDGSLNRFKFGFTADDFSTYLYSARTNPQYAAEIEVVGNLVDTSDANNVPLAPSNLAVPLKFRWSLKHALNMDLPYIDHKMLSQDGATVSIDPVQPACVPVSNTITINTQVTVVSNALCFSSATVPDRSLHGSASAWVGRADPGAVMHSYFSSQSRTASVYFAFPYDPIVRVYQSKNSNYSNATMIIDSASAVALSNNDRQWLLNDPQTAAFWQLASRSGMAVWQGIAGSLGLMTLQDIDGPSGPAVAGAGKMDFTHNPANGRYYYVTITNMVMPNGTTPWAYYAMLRYPTDTITGGTETRTIIDPCGKTGAATGYTGIATARYGHNSAVIPDGTREFDSVIINATGLLPNTRHELYVNGLKNTTAVRPFGASIGSPLMSDPFGRLTLEYLLPMTNWAAREAELGLTTTPDSSRLILNEGQNFDNNFIGNAYQLFEILAPNSRAGAKLSYVPWTAY
jgi:Domain of unknown function (DUF4815)